MRTLSKLGLLAVIAATGAACQAVSDTNAQESPFQAACSIETQSLSGATMLTGLARGLEGETGRYKLTLKGGDGRNSTSTSQGGAFSIGAGGEARTGTVRLSSTGIYDAEFQVTLAGTTHTCSKRIGNNI